MKEILVCLDFSDATDAVIEAAWKLAKAFDAQLHLLHVAPPDPDFVGYEVGPQHERAARAMELRDEHKQLQRIATHLEGFDLRVVPLLVAGATVEKIVEQMNRLEADLVILGSHGHGAVYNLLVGSVAEGVMRKTTRPVLIVPLRK